MEDFRIKQKIRKKVYSRWVFFSLLILTALLLQGVFGAWKKHQASKKNLEVVEKNLTEARMREKELDTQIEVLNTQEGIESEIRERFSVTRPGEEIVLIIDDLNNESIEPDKDESFWRKIKGWFAGFSR